MGKIFISYAHEDQIPAQRICDRLQSLGFKPWIDRQAPAARDDISTVIDGQIGQVDAVLVLWSDYARNSVWVRGEALRGLEHSKYFGVLLKEMAPPVPFNAMAAPNLTDWSGLQSHAGWSGLVRGLAELSADTRSEILCNLEKLQASEREEAEREVEAQIQLPLPEEVAEEVADQAADVGPHYIDVDGILASAKFLAASAAKLDLASALTQATLDQEMLRDASYVVSAKADVPRPSGASFTRVETIAEALKRAAPNQLIVLDSGEYNESLRITKIVRLVGLGNASSRPVIRGTRSGPALAIAESARIENVAIETREEHFAVHCESGQPTLLKCDVRRFSKARDESDAALYVAGRANPIIIASSVTTAGCSGLHFVSRAAGKLVGVEVMTMRGRSMVCRGRPLLVGVRMEAIGAHAVEVLGVGSPTFEECDIAGRGASVVHVAGYGRPRISQSRVSAIRQLAFDFEENATGHFEGNVVSLESSEQAGTAKPDWTSVFGKLKSKEKTIAETSRRILQIVRVRDASRPIFVSNITGDGALLDQPGSFRDF